MRTLRRTWSIFFFCFCIQSCWSYLFARQSFDQTQLQSATIDALRDETIDKQPASLADRIQLYQQTLESLTRLTTLPTCQRAVTDALLQSCDNLDRSFSREELQSENVKTAYAIGLALCELNDATSSVPSVCEPFLPSESSKKPTGLKIQPCLQELSLSPQSWTSYSNNKQNAWKICRLSKLSSEQNNYLHKLQQGIDNHALADRVFADALFNWQQDINARKTAADEFEISSRESQDNIRNQWDEIRNRLETEGHENFHKIREWVHELLAPQTQVKDELMITIDTLGALREELARLKNTASESMDSILTQESSLATIRVTHHDLAKRDIADLSLSIKSLIDHDLAKLTQGLSRHWNEQQHFHRMQRIQINELYNSTLWTMQNMARLKANLTDVVHQVHILTSTMATLDSVSDSLRTIVWSCFVIGAILGLWLFDRKLAAVVSAGVLFLNHFTSRVYEKASEEPPLLTIDVAGHFSRLFSFMVWFLAVLALYFAARFMFHFLQKRLQQRSRFFKEYIPHQFIAQRISSLRPGAEPESLQIMQYDGETEQFFILDDFNQRSRPIFVE